MYIIFIIIMIDYFAGQTVDKMIMPIITDNGSRFSDTEFCSSYGTVFLIHL